jgi:hypothetical protein
LNKILVVDIHNIKLINIFDYEKVYLLVYANQELNNFEENFYEKNGITVVSSEYYYTKINIAISNFIKQNYKNNSYFLMLFKSIRMKLYDLFFIFCFLEKIESNVDLVTRYNKHIKEIGDLDHVTILNSKNTISFYKIKICYILIRSLISFVSQFYVNRKKFQIIFIDYPSKNVVKHLEFYFDNTMTLQFDFDFGVCKSPLNKNNFLLFLKLFFNIILIAQKYKFTEEHLYIPLLESYKYSVLLSKYDIKMIAGVLDDGFGQDILSFLCKNNDIKLACFTHCSHLYPFKIEFLSSPFNYYFASSEYYKELVMLQDITDTKCNFINIGYANYANNIISKYSSVKIEKQYDLIFVGDYYHDSLAINPFTPCLTKRIAKALLELSHKYKILIRPRNKDKYYNDLFEVLGSSVDYSLGDDRLTVYEDIKSAKLGVAAYTNALRDGLLMHVPFVHINWIDLETTNISMAKDSAIYYSQNEDELHSLVEMFFNNELKELEFEKNNQKYSNSGKFEPEIALEILKKETK